MEFWTLNRMLCGGTTADSSQSCEMFDGSSSTFSTVSATLRDARYNLLCWGLQSGAVLLLGGGSNVLTVEKVSNDDPYSRGDFQLVYGIS